MQSLSHRAICPGSIKRRRYANAKCSKSLKQSAESRAKGKTTNSNAMRKSKKVKQVYVLVKGIKVCTRKLACFSTDGRKGDIEQTWYSLS